MTDDDRLAAEIARQERVEGSVVEELNSDRPVYVILTPGTIDALVARIDRMLTGKLHVTVAVNEYFDFKPEVRANQRFTKVSGKVHDINGKKLTQILLHNSYGVWDIGRAARMDMGRDSMTIRDRTGSGHVLYWVFQVTGPDLRAT